MIDKILAKLFLYSLNYLFERRGCFFVYRQADGSVQGSVNEMLNRNREKRESLPFSEALSSTTFWL